MEIRTWKIFFICFDKYFGTYLVANFTFIELFKYIGSKLKYIYFVSIDLAIYDMQITSYDANLIFLDEFIIYVIIQHIKSLSMYFLL